MSFAEGQTGSSANRLEKELLRAIVALELKPGTRLSEQEIAGSPLPSINEIGPPAIVSDFGNNTAIALGAPLAIAQGLSDIETAMLIDGEVAGRGRSHGPNGGPLDALLFLVNHLADRGRGLAKGEVVSAGATTGVHPIAIGRGAEAVCAGAPPLSVRLVGREPAR